MASTTQAQEADSQKPSISKSAKPPSPTLEPSAPVLRSQGTMNKDSSFTHIHMSAARNADFFEDFCRDRLPADDIYVPPHLAPINPEDEDDVVPDQHAAFGIQKALTSQRGSREPAWKDLGLAELMRKGPPVESAGTAGGWSGMPRARGKLPR